MHGYCIACDKPLTGKQRFYCCDKCRKRYSRMAEKYPALSDNQPLTDFFVRQSTAIVRHGPVITIQIVVRYNSGQWADTNRGMDNWAIKSQFKNEITKNALEWLRKEFPRWEFELVGSEVHKNGG